MLAYLNIRNIVLIEALDLDCRQGLSVLTGETGAGKSILLDALGLALGMRAEIGLVRKGADRASVTAGFSFADNTHPVFTELKQQDIYADFDIILRRSLTADGRSRAFINDHPVGIALLKEIGTQLVEIHGQFETQGLLHVKTHRHVLDRYGEHASLMEKLSLAWKNWQIALDELQKAQASIIKNKEDEDYLKHMVEELKRLAPEDGEEEVLMKKRALLGNQEKLVEAAQQCQHLLSGESGAETLLRQAQGSLDKISQDIDLAGLNNAVAALDRAGVELADAVFEIDSLGGAIAGDDASLDMIEERLFALRDCARKHGCSIGDLPVKQEELLAQLRLIDNEDAELDALEKREQDQRYIYHTHARELTKQRHQTGKKLQEFLKHELPQLKLEKVQFVTDIETFDAPEKWTAEGMDDVRFLVATNPGQTPAPLQKAASGGELSRLMLAFKVVMAGKNRVPVLVFDEIDAGVGGAVADAVGAHLKKLSCHHQILVVTHSPQVAAKSGTHWVISKTVKDDNTVTNVVELETKHEQREEIARMLSGQDVTAEARAAAAKLIGTTGNNKAA